LGRSSTTESGTPRPAPIPSDVLVLALVALLALLAAPRSVLAGPTQDAAWEAEQARRAYNLGHWAEAADGYEKAYRLHPDPVLLFDRAQALRNLGRVPEALANYRAYLREMPDAQNRVAVEARIRELEQRRSAPIPAAPGGLPAHAQGASPQPPAPLTPMNIRSARAPLERRDVSRIGWLTWAGAGATLALAGGAIVSGLAVNSSFKEMKQTCALTTDGCPEERISTLKSRVLVTNLLWGAAAVAGAATGVSFFVGSGEGGVTMAGRF
jgi:tetratricopeptide (TPR) repeat protein